MTAQRKLDNGLTGEEDLFARMVFTHGDTQRAYIESRVGGRTLKNRKGAVRQAALLLEKPLIIARIVELRNSSNLEAKYGNEEAMAEADEAFLLAKEQGDPKGMIAATQLKSRLQGLIIDRKIVEQRSLKDQPDEYISRQLREVEEEIARTRAAALEARDAPKRTGRAGSGSPAGGSKTLQ